MFFIFINSKEFYFFIPYINIFFYNINFFNFYTNVYRDGGSGSLWADWYVNNSAKGFRMYTYYHSGWELIGGSIVLSLSQNDYVQVYAGTSGNWDGGSYGSFNGYFLG